MPTERSERTATGLSPLAVAGLAVLAVPRAVLHDLDAAGPALNAVLVFAPPVVWVLVVLALRVPSPMRALLAVGLVYGLLLAVTHQVLWSESFTEEPTLGGNLVGVLDPGTETVLLRAFAFVSSVVTGTVVGALAGAVASLLARLLPRRDR
ncbi:hypothetical protein BAY60_08475 [Prauserella muralis]|uniref:Uncharacterized protein n=1 Tax=Prauserella muralis TaxID=588067 RepID=A0A2V4BCP3_9PSEU|nr:hypothetical protein BAY60_08475 [Prauserella muralis]